MGMVLRIILIVLIVLVLLSLAWGTEAPGPDKAMNHPIQMRTPGPERCASVSFQPDHVVHGNIPGAGVSW